MSLAKNLSKCSLCGENKPKFLLNKDGVDIIRCGSCGLIYRDPLPAVADELALHRNALLVKESRDEFIVRNQPLLKYCLLQVSRRSPRGKMLDVGCQFGYFLQLAKEQGWQTYGVEISEKAASFAQQRLNLNVFSGTLRQANFPDQTFDAVSLWGVLNQLVEPSAELQEIRRILKKTGLLSLRLQNANFHLALYRFYRLFQVIFKIFKIDPISEFHVYEFSSLTIRRILENNGFHEVEVENSPLTKSDLYYSFKYIHPVLIEMLKKVFFGLTVLFYRLSFKKIVFSSSMIIHARKK